MSGMNGAEVGIAAWLIEGLASLLTRVDLASVECSRHRRWRCGRVTLVDPRDLSTGRNFDLGRLEGEIPDRHHRRRALSSGAGHRSRWVDHYRRAGHRGRFSHCNGIAGDLHAALHLRMQAAGIGEGAGRGELQEKSLPGSKMPDRTSHLRQ